MSHYHVGLAPSAPGALQAPWHGHHPGSPATGNSFHQRFVGGAAGRDAGAVGEALPPATAGGPTVAVGDVLMGRAGD